MQDTSGADYAARLHALQGKRWKRLLNVQAPYQWNLRRRHLGRTLEIGCGIGRNLASLGAGSVGVDHNEVSIRAVREAGFVGYTVEEWATAPERVPGTFDSLLVAHVIEHMDAATGLEMMRGYLPFLRPGGQVMFICPQERGYASDPTHVRWTTAADLERLAGALGLVDARSLSFPLPRWAGRLFTYNEFNVLAVKPV